MRRNALRIFGLFFTLATLVTAIPRAQAQTICPVCIEGYKCCIKGDNARCIPENRNC
ncbi:MAG TPA: hypothetical protein VIW92_05270 [Thermoanaerobaculia bacterium]